MHCFKTLFLQKQTKRDKNAVNMDKEYETENNKSTFLGEKTRPWL